MVDVEMLASLPTVLMIRVKEIPTNPDSQRYIAMMHHPMQLERGEWSYGGDPVQAVTNLCLSLHDASTRRAA